MKCGKDLDAVKASESFFDAPEGGAFTPQGSLDDSPLRRSRHDSEPGIEPGDHAPAAGSGVDDILNAEYAKAAAFDADDFGEEQPEIQQSDVTSDAGERQTVCDTCGAVNPHEQRYCRSCGSALSAAGAVTGERPTARGGGGGPGGRDEPGLSDQWAEAGTEQEYGDSFGYASDAPLAAEEPLMPLVETSLLTSISPSSDYYSSETATGRRRRSRGGKIEWSARDWLILIGLTLILLLGIWLFFLGGMDLFSGKVRNLKKAGRVMSKLSSFEFSVDGSMESEQAGSFDGSGSVRFEAPDRSAWSFTTAIPGKPPVVTQQAEVAGKPYVNGGGAWSPAGAETARPDVKNLWTGFSSVEDLGQATCGTSQCFHYKYRTAPGTLTGMLGAWDPSGVSDAVMEAWIDMSNHRIVKMTAQVYNVQLEGVRTTVSLTFDLAAVDKPYNIGAPI